MHTTTIDVKLRKKDEFYSQYNDGKLSKDLAKYLKQECYGGILFLFIYYLFKRIEVFSEIMLILGWLAIWESTYSFIFNGLSLKIKIKRLKEITKAKINFIQEK